MSESENLVPGATASSIQRADSPLDLRELTPARIALDSTGASIATRPALEFVLAHAQARDAVHSSLTVPSLMAALRERGLAAVSIRSAVADRTEYLRRPDLGRTLSAVSTAALAQAKSATANRQSRTALGLILADGLSALATERHALPVVDALLLLLGIGASDCTWVLTPIVIAEQARVALGDEIGHALGADIAVILIGERPGLSSPDSLGAYITWSPRPGRTDAERNCVSNIRTEGLDYGAAAAKIAWYITEGRRLGLSGVKIREGSLPDATEP
jgi:ethanolamine ammonia-lyase small subunit